MGPGDYLLQYRLNQAKKLLITNRSPLHEVAQAAGFNDPFHFSKAFKKQFEISPSDFRAKFINNTC
jgi:AraC-like DNA-binding protein